MARIILIFWWVVLTIVSTLLAFKITLNSDSLFLDAVMVDIFGRGGAWSNWKITPAPAYFPDMFVYAVGYYLIPTPVLRITFVCVVQALLLASVSINFAKMIRPSHSKWQSILILILISIFTLVAANSSMWLFFNSTNNHFAALLFPFFVGYMIFRYWDFKNLSSIIWIILSVFAGASSTPVFLLSFTIPFLIFAILSIAVFRREKTLRNFFIKVICFVFIGHIIAFLFNLFVISYDTFGGRVPVTIDAAKISLGAFFDATKLTFGKENLYTYALSIFSVAAIGVVLFNLLKEFNLSIGQEEKKSNCNISFETTSSRLRYFSVFIFFVITFPVCLLGPIVSGGFVDPWGYRYLAFPIALGLLLFVTELDEIINKRYLLTSNIFYFISIILLSIIIIFSLLSARKLIFSSGRESVTYLFDKGIRNTGDDIEDCIKKEEEGGFKFQAGVADFWDSRGVIYKAKNIPFILPVTNDLRPFFHMMTLGPLLNPAKYDISLYNFLIAKKSGTITSFNMTPEKIEEILPPPTKIVDCKNTDSSLWLYNNSQLDVFIKNNISNFLLQIGRSQGFSMTGSAFPGQIGRVEAASRVANSSQDAPGFLAYGPYVKMREGKYKAVISYESTENDNRWDAGRFNDSTKNITIISGNFPAGRGVMSFNF